MDFKKLLNKKVIAAVVALAAAVAGAYGYNLSPEFQAAINEMLGALAVQQ